MKRRKTNKKTAKISAEKAHTLPTQERFRIILVEPEYELNIGAVARAMKNFGFSDLAFVSPKCNPKGFDAIKYSKHARDIIESAQSFPSLSSAAKGCKFKVGTTGILYRHWSETFRSPISLRDLRGKIGNSKEGKIAVIFGNEGVGLSEKHISACDLLVTIPTSEKYSILNLSHAVAICLYELSEFNPKLFIVSGKQEKEQLELVFGRLVDRFAKDMRNPKKVKVAFRRMVGKALLSDKECSAILGVLGRADKELSLQKK